MQHAIERGLHECDLCRGSEGYKQWLGGVARTNLQSRIYRSHFDRWLDCAITPVLTSIRSNTVLRSTYLKLRKEAVGE
jgi:hypothetical protein